MNTIQNQNLSFASKFPLVNRGVPAERFKELARRYDMNEYLNILGQHYDVKGVVTQSPHFRNNVTLELSCLDESKKKTKWGRFVENIMGSRKVFERFHVGSYREATDLLNTDIRTPFIDYNRISKKHLECRIHATEPSRSFREYIVNALKERAGNPKCDQEQKTKASQVCEKIEDLATWKKQQRYNEELEHLQEYYGDDTRIDLNMHYFGWEQKGFSTSI